MRKTEFSLNGVLQSEFPADSRVNYDKIESDVFKALGITKDKFSEEVHSLGDKKAPSNTEDLLILEPSSSNKSRRLNEDTSYDYTSTATNTSELLTASPPSTGTLRNVNPTSGFQSSSSDGRGSAWNVERGEYISEYSGRLDDRNTTKTSLGHWLPKASINVNIPSQNPMNQLYSSHSVGRQDVILNQGTDTSSERHVDYNFPSDPSDTHQSAKLDVWTDALQQTSSAPKVEVKQKQVKLQLHKIEDEDW